MGDSPFFFASFPNSVHHQLTSGLSFIFGDPHQDKWLVDKDLKAFIEVYGNGLEYTSSTHIHEIIEWITLVGSTHTHSRYFSNSQS